MATCAEKVTGDGLGWGQRRPGRPEVALKRVVVLAQSSIGGCDAASVTLVRGGRAIPVVSTADVARELDSAQCRAGEGPCLDAIRQLQVFNVSIVGDARSWPGFSKEATARGILSSLSVPVTVGGEAVGALNLYGRGADAFAGCEAVAVVFGSHAASTLSGALPRLRATTEDRTTTV